MATITEPALTFATEAEARAAAAEYVRLWGPGYDGRARVFPSRHGGPTPWVMTADRMSSCD